jgi:hypothetical protein
MKNTTSESVIIIIKKSNIYIIISYRYSIPRGVQDNHGDIMEALANLHHYHLLLVFAIIYLTLKLGILDNRSKIAGVKVEKK